MKIVIIGDTKVGKTSLILRLQNNTYEEDTKSTIGASLFNHSIQLDDRLVQLQIWDTAGQEKFRTLAPMYYRSAKIAIICYDISSSLTFHELKSWINELEMKGPRGLISIIVGNKKDKEKEREVSYEEGQQFCNEHDCAFFIEVSAKTGEGINELFKKVAEFDDQEIILPETKPIKVNQIEKESKSCC